MSLFQFFSYHHGVVWNLCVSVTVLLNEKLRQQIENKSFQQRMNNGKLILPIIRCSCQCWILMSGMLNDRKSRFNFLSNIAHFVLLRNPKNKLWFKVINNEFWQIIFRHQQLIIFRHEQDSVWQDFKWIGWSWYIFMFDVCELTSYMIQEFNK